LTLKTKLDNIEKLLKKITQDKKTKDLLYNDLKITWDEMAENKINWDKIEQEDPIEKEINDC
jgi:hypothetical protein